MNYSQFELPMYSQGNDGQQAFNSLMGVDPTQANPLVSSLTPSVTGDWAGLARFGQPAMSPMSFDANAGQGGFSMGGIMKSIFGDGTKDAPGSLGSIMGALNGIMGMRNARDGLKLAKEQFGFNKQVTMGNFNNQLDLLQQGRLDQAAARAAASPNYRGFDDGAAYSKANPLQRLT
jgi:hypothetical protein